MSKDCLIKYTISFPINAPVLSDQRTICFISKDNAHTMGHTHFNRYPKFQVVNAANVLFNCENLVHDSVSHQKL